MHNASRNTGDAFPSATWDVHSPIFIKQMSYINLSLRAPHESSKEGRDRRKERKKVNKGKIRKAFFKAAGSIMSDPTCYNACTQTNGLNNSEDVVTTALCIKNSQDACLYLSSPSFLIKRSNWW